MPRDVTSFVNGTEISKNYRIGVKNQKVFYLAGLLIECKIGGGKGFYCNIVTTEPNEQIGRISNTMPAIIIGENTSTVVK